jgi:hypothetical protein
MSASAATARMRDAQRSHAALVEQVAEHMV